MPANKRLAGMARSYIKTYQDNCISDFAAFVSMNNSGPCIGFGFGFAAGWGAGRAGGLLP